MKVMLIGATGQLGTDLGQVLTKQQIVLHAFAHPELDICDSSGLENAIASTKPNIVISTAAFHKVEVCEAEPATSFAVNGIGPLNLALACRRHDCALVHFSTDYVFDGLQSHPYTETDLPNPLNVYATSKLAGEHMVRSNWEKHFVVRTCGLYGVVGSAGKGGNFVETMLKKAAEGAALSVVNDQVLTPTFTGDLAEVVAKLIRTSTYGLYHISAEGQCSWYDFAKKIFELEGVAANLSPVASNQYPNPVRRPAYSVLSKQKLNELGLKMPPWEEGLRRYLLARKRMQHAAKLS